MFQEYCLEVLGDFACFTRPEMKAERVSYDFITPSSARSIFEAILWKPAISWKVTKIDILQPINWTNIKRNEISTKIPERSIQTQMKLEKGYFGKFIEDDRTQRSSLILRDVKYRIYAQLNYHKNKDPEGNYQKYTTMFERRAKKGQCFYQPYLGCREFSCHFRFIDELDNEPLPISINRNLGWMLYDLDFSDPQEITPKFFQAEINSGTVIIPAFDSEGVRG